MGRAAAPLRVGEEGRVLAGETTLMRSSSSLSCWEAERRTVKRRLMSAEDKDMFSRTTQM